MFLDLSQVVNVTLQRLASQATTKRVRNAPLGWEEQTQGANEVNAKGLWGVCFFAASRANILCLVGSKQVAISAWAIGQ